jgi:hypothetical protein
VERHGAWYEVTLAGGGGVGRRRQGRDVGRREIGSHRVGQATRGWMVRGQELRCRSGSVGSGGWREVGQASRADTREVGRLGVRGSVGLLGQGDGSLVHRPR